jgi:dienelactone hydrolase
MKPFRFSWSLPLLAATYVFFILPSSLTAPQLLFPQDEWTQRAVQFVDFLKQERWSEAQAMLSRQMADAFSGNKLATTWKSLQSQAGQFVAIQAAQRQEQQGFHIVDLAARFTNTDLRIRVVFDAKKKVSGLWFLPAEPPPYEAPGYVDKDAFKEVDVTFGEAPWELPGTLSIPQGDGPFPAVVLVHGSGPNDRDETLGPNRPFRDLAWGLVSRSIAVLRYDKRTKVYAQKMKDSTVTVEEEVIVDALAAVDFLRQRSEVKPGAVFLLGHSLGATLAPEIALRDGKLAGVIMLAAIARPLDKVALEQIEYIASLKNEATDAQRAHLDSLREKLKRLVRGELQPNEMVLGARAAYFYDMRKRNQVESAKKLKAPMLILQGGRDYQATTEDYALWKRALGKREDVTLKLYPDLNHLFIAGEGMATPQEYMQPGHVDARVIEEIAAWILDQTRRRAQ